jgi:hypothetical protein
MEEQIRRYAELSVARGCGFAALAVATVMVGSASDLTLFFRSGGFGALLVCFILLLKASRVDRIPFKSTEVWIMLPVEHRPPPEIAAGLIAKARRRSLLRFAYGAAIIAGLELTADLVLVLSKFA